jgi:hypothetical protein
MRLSLVLVAAAAVLLSCAGALAIEEDGTTGGAACLTVSDCGGESQGTCVGAVNATNKGKCECKAEYADEDCSYKRKNGGLAGGLQFLCFITVGGVGNFILGRVGAGVAQLLMLYIGCCCSTVLQNVARAQDNSPPVLGAAVFCCCIGCAAFIWCIVDGAMILEGQVLDSEGWLPYIE